MPTTQPVVPCASCPLRRTRAFNANTVDEIAAVQQFKQGERRVPAGEAIIREGAPGGQLMTLLSGWAFRFKSLSDGRRQILNFLLPGDFIGLQERLTDVSAAGVEALVDARLCTFSVQGLWPIFSRFPTLGFDITWLAAHEEGIVDEGMLTVGRRTATERVAMLMLHLHKRAVAVGMGTDGAVRFPVRQHHIADALGLSLVHTNRTVRKLQRLGLCSIADGQLRLPNPKALERLADFYERPPPQRPLI